MDLYINVITSLGVASPLMLVTIASTWILAAFIQLGIMCCDASKKLIMVGVALGVSLVFTLPIAFMASHYILVMGR